MMVAHMGSCRASFDTGGFPNGCGVGRHGCGCDDAHRRDQDQHDVLGSHASKPARCCAGDGWQARERHVSWGGAQGPQLGGQFGGVFLFLRGSSLPLSACPSVCNVKHPSFTRGDTSVCSDCCETHACHMCTCVTSLLYQVKPLTPGQLPRSIDQELLLHPFTRTFRYQQVDDTSKASRLRGPWLVSDCVVKQIVYALISHAGRRFNSFKARTINVQLRCRYLIVIIVNNYSCFGSASAPGLVRRCPLALGGPVLQHIMLL